MSTEGKPLSIRTISNLTELIDLQKAKIGDLQAQIIELEAKLKEKETSKNPQNPAKKESTESPVEAF